MFRRNRSSRPLWNRIAVGLGMAATVYVLLAAALVVVEDRLVFMPSSESQWWRAKKMPPWPQNVFFETRNGTKIHAWWFPHPNAKCAAIYCHGNNKNLSLFRTCRHHNPSKWHSMIGASLLIFDYPGYGRSLGTPSEQGCYDAADAAHQWLVHHQNTSPHEIIIVGQSLGSAVAVDLASRRRHKALVLIAAFTSIPDVAVAMCPLIPARFLMRNRFDSLAKIHRCAQPTLFFHGSADLLVPVRQGRMLFESSGAERKRFVEVSGAPHHISVGGCFFDELSGFFSEESAEVSSQNASER